MQVRVNLLVNWRLCVLNEQIDLVHGMINVASGKGIPSKLLEMVQNNNDEGGGTTSTEQQEMDQDGRILPYHGHAIEAQIYAEDPNSTHHHHHQIDMELTGSH